jgi:hypothetical protein
MMQRTLAVAALFLLSQWCCAAGDPASAASDVSSVDKPCPIKADEAFARARATGYRFEGARVTGEGECLASDGFPSFIGRAGTQVLQCRFRGFAGPALKAAWRLTSATLHGGPFTLISPLSGEQSPIGTAPVEFTVDVPATKELKVVLVTVEIKGSDCERWKEAF